MVVQVVECLLIHLRNGVCRFESYPRQLSAFSLKIIT